MGSLDGGSAALEVPIPIQGLLCLWGLTLPFSPAQLSRLANWQQ